MGHRKRISTFRLPKTEKYLEAEDVEVVLTRETEDGLYDAHASNKKVQDMKRRIEIIEKPILF